MKSEELTSVLSENVDRNFEQLVRTYQDRLYSFALRMTHHPHDAEEMVQEGFVRAYRALRGYPAERIKAMKLKPWLYRIVLNVFRNRFRSRSPQWISWDRVNEKAVQEWAHQGRSDPEAMLEAKASEERVKRALDSLPERYRLPLILRYGESLGYEEMRRVLGQPEGTLKSIVHRAILRLRHSLGQDQRS